MVGIECYRCKVRDVPLSTWEMKSYCKNCWDKIGTPYKPKKMSLDDLKKDLGK